MGAFFSIFAFLFQQQSLTTSVPTSKPTPSPSTSAPSLKPSVAPTSAPSLTPSVAPTIAPSLTPSVAPTIAPSLRPSQDSTISSSLPSLVPSSFPSNAASYFWPTYAPEATVSCSSIEAPMVMSFALVVPDGVNGSLSISEQETLPQLTTTYLMDLPQGPDDWDVYFHQVPYLPWGVREIKIDAGIPDPEYNVLVEINIPVYASSCLYNSDFFDLDDHLLDKHDDALFLQQITSQIPSLSSASSVKWLPSREPEDTFIPSVTPMP